MLAWSEGDNGRQAEIMVAWRHCRRRAIYWLLRSPANDTLNPNSNQQAPDSNCWWWDALQAAPAWRAYLKGQDAVATSRRRWRFTTMIDRGVVGQSTVAALSGLLRRRWIMVSSSMGWQPDCKIQRSGRNGQRDWCMSRVTPRLSPSRLSPSSSCHGLLIITVITPLPTRPARQKCQRTEAGEPWQLLTCRCVSVMLRIWCIHEGVSWC